MLRGFGNIGSEVDKARRFFLDSKSGCLLRMKADKADTDIPVLFGSGTVEGLHVMLNASSKILNDSSLETSRDNFNRQQWNSPNSIVPLALAS